MLQRMIMKVQMKPWKKLELYAVLVKSFPYQSLVMVVVRIRTGFPKLMTMMNFPAILLTIATMIEDISCVVICVLIMNVNVAM